MYQAVYHEWPNKYWLRDDVEGWMNFDYNPTYYEIDPNGTFSTLDGKLAKSTKKFVKENHNLYEKDIDPKTRILIDLYKDSDNTPKFHNVVYFDIECEIGGTLTTEYIKSAPMKITSISLYDSTSQKYYCLILDEEKLLINGLKEGIKRYNNERELLKSFLQLWEELDPTIITGWNSSFFDVPYLYYRILNVLGERDACRLSPIQKIKFTEWDITQPIIIGGLNHLDYMLLFKKYVVKQEPSYKLKDIGEKYINLSKIEYEGSLDDLYKDDINKFIEYNIRDVEIIVKLEEKLKFIDLTVTICHLCHVPYDQIYLSTVLNDGAILTYLKRKNIVSPNKPTTIRPSLKDVTQDYAGGYLKIPVPNLYKWVIDLDYTSLYPSIIRSLNIGIETLVGRIVNNDKYDNNWTLGDLKKLNKGTLITIEKLNENRSTNRTQVEVSKLIDYIESENIIVAASGGLFRTDKSSVVCDVLTDWFNKRVEYKNQMKEAKKKGDKALADFCDRRQHAYKIKLNDVYGCYAINGWRYTDGHKMISESITLTGQRLLQESIKYVNQYLNEIMNTINEDYVVTGDTDSVFIHVEKLLQFRYSELDLNNKEEVIPKILEIASELQKVTNKYISEFVISNFNLNNREHYFELKQEVVIERGYFANKRRYAMLIVNKEGVAVEEMVMMGLDLMKSNMPPLYKTFGKELLTEIMKGKPKEEIDKKIQEFRKYIKNRPIGDIAKPTGVRNIKKYTKSSPKMGEIFSSLHLKTPINTKAAIYYNDLIIYKKLDKEYSLFTEGDKMKYIPLKDNPYNIEVIGYANNNPEFINEFIEQYADRDQGFESILQNKLMSIYEDLKWEWLPLNEKVHKFFKFE